MANNFLPFCPTDTGTNLLSQVDYAAATDRTIGNQPGVASSKLVNKAARQASFIASQLAQYIADKNGVDVLDDGVTSTLLAQMKATFLPKVPVIQKFTSGSGTYNKSYVFTIASGSATVGATYTNNAITFTVVATVASATQVVMTGSGPSLASGTLTKASGTGDSTLTFFASQAPLYIHVQAVAGGGGGGGSGSGAGDGSNGNNTTFGTTLIVCGAGAHGFGFSGQAGDGGTASLGTGPVGKATAGNAGNVSGAGSGPWGGAGNTSVSAPGGASDPNSGSGGAGASANTPNVGGGGGGAGGYVNAFIYTPSNTYAWVCGAGGAGGTAGSGGVAGAAGASGIIIVTEYFQ